VKDAIAKKRRALPAVALASDMAAVTAVHVAMGEDDVL